MQASQRDEGVGFNLPQVEKSTELETPTAANDEGLDWYAARTYSFREFVVAELLKAQRIEHYLPVMTERRRWSDRIKTLQVPVFRNYLFVRVDPMQESFWQVLKTRGVASILGNDCGPIPIKAKEIDSVIRMVEAGMALQTSREYHEGDRVRITTGPLEGMEGTFVRIDGKHHLAIRIEILGQTVLTVVDCAIVQKC